MENSVGPSKHDGTETYDVFVGGLQDTATDRKVHNRFSAFGEIHSIAVIKGKYPGTKVAFVRFFSKMDADKAVMETNGEMFDGKFLIVRRSKVREQSYEENNNRPSQTRGSWNQNKEGYLRNATETNGSSSKPEMEERQVFVTQVDDACTFWGQNMKVGDKIMQFSRELQGVCAQAPLLTGPPQPDKLYGAKFSEDQQWYRCKVVDMVSKDQAQVQYVDYGNSETVQVQGMCQLTQDVASLPPYAECYRLSGMMCAAKDQNQGLTHLRSLIDFQAVLVKVKARSQDGPIEADVTVGGVRVSQSMMEKGFIVEKPTKESPSKLTPPTPNTTERMNTKVDNSDGDVLRNMQIQESKLQDMEKRIKGLVQERLTLLDQVDMLQKALDLQVQDVQEKQKKLDELQNTVQDKDSALQQLKTTNQEKDKMLANCTSRQIQALSAQVKKVKLGRQEMPADQGVADPIQQAIATVTDATQRIGPSDIQSIVKVSDALGKLKKLQGQIGSYREKDDTLTSLIAQRNDAWKEAQAAMTECIQDMQNLPLDFRLSYLQDNITSIERTYKKYVSPNLKFGGKPSTETFQAFLEWRTQKVQNLQSLRRTTNQHCKEVCQELKTVIQSLSSLLSQDTCSGNDVQLDTADSPGYYLDELLSDFDQAMAQELAKSSLEEGSDVKLMTAVVNSLLNELRGEIEDIQKLQDLLARNLKCQDDMTRWLATQPDLEPLRQVKREIRALKSEIRHKMADKQDLEEEDPAGAQLQQVECHLMDLRERIQEAFSREHLLMEEAAAQATSHYPEIPLLHPELNLADFIESAGLVKMGWELKHYNVSPVPLALTKGSAPSSAPCSSAVLTTFNHKPVVIKEYMLEGGKGSERSQEAVLARTREFHSLKHPNLIPLESVFFSKMKRQMYVQMPYYLGARLMELQDSNPLKDFEACLVLKGILEALSHLHSNGVTHGSVTPQYVQAPGRTKGILDNYDFCKTPTQRAAAPFLTPNGLSFVPPEVGKGQPASPASDMYQFGVLVLWMHYPADSFKNTDWGVPNLRGITLDVKLREFLPKLLQANSSARPTADSVLQLKFFQDPPKSPQLNLAESPVNFPSPVQQAAVLDTSGGKEEEISRSCHRSMVSPIQSVPSPALEAPKPLHSPVSLRTSPPAGCVIPTASPRALTSNLDTETPPQVTSGSSTAADQQHHQGMSEIEHQIMPCSPSPSSVVPNSNIEAMKPYTDVPSGDARSSDRSQESLQQQLDILKAKGEDVLSEYSTSSPDITGNAPIRSSPGAFLNNSGDQVTTSASTLPTSTCTSPVKPTANIQPTAISGNPQPAVCNSPADCETSGHPQETGVATSAAASTEATGFTTSMRASLEAAYQSLGLIMSPSKYSSSSSQPSSSGADGSMSFPEEAANSLDTESTFLEGVIDGTSSPLALSSPPSPLRTTPEMVAQQTSPLRVGMGGLSSQLNRNLPESYISPNGTLPALVSDTGMDGSDVPDSCNSGEKLDSLY